MPAKNKSERKKAIFFTIDAMIGTAIIVASLILISKMYIQNPEVSNLRFESQDLLNALSNIKTGEINNSYVKNLINESVISQQELNNSLLEEIGVLYVKGYQEEARNLIRNITNNLDENTEISVFLNDNLIFNTTNKSENIISYSRLISGIEIGKEIIGYSARASISSINGKTFDKYVFFGGLEGEGNLSFTINMPNFTKVNRVIVEVETPLNFSMSINGNPAGKYPNSQCTKLDNVSACQINNTYYSLIREGENEVKIVFEGPLNLSYIGGGYFRINFDTPLLNYSTIKYDESTDTASVKENLIGVQGVINKYGSIYVPGNLTSMNIFVNATTNYPFFITLGNITIYDGATHNETGNISINLTNSNLSTKINYTLISDKTVPLRIGHNSILIERVLGHNADIVLITDLSGSMSWRFDSDETGVTRTCTDPNLFSNDTRRISVAKCLDKQFVDTVMNGTNGNRIWLVDFNDHAEYYYSEDESELISHINSYPDDPSGGTCLCCALNEAHNILETYSNASRKKFIILMTDGLPNYCCGRRLLYCHWWWCYYTCDPYGTSTSEEYYSSYCSGGSSDCTGTDCEGPINSSINAAQRDHDDLNATIDTIGFGPVKDCENANYTLKKIAETGNGTFYASNDPNRLNDIYDEIAKTINERSAAYINQRITVENISSDLYDNSYIKIEYTPHVKPFVYGKIPLTTETNRFNNNITEGQFTVPHNTTVISAFVTSYSGDFWTSNVTLNSKEIFNIDDYNTSYLGLGDPFKIYLPLEKIQEGNNSVIIKTATDNETRGGNKNDKAVVTLLVPNFVTFSTVEPNAKGCNWTITFEDGSSTNIKVPSNYSEKNSCRYEANGAEPTCTYNGTSYTDDAINKATCVLLSKLDPDLNGKLNVKINQSSININLVVIKNVPSLWGPSLIKVAVSK